MKRLRKSAIINGRSRIVVRATNWIGDSVMTMPAVQRLRELAPEAHIALVCPEKLHDLWRHNPFINEVITFDSPLSIRRLRQGKFDLAVIFPNSFRSAWESWCAWIPVRVGFAGHRRRYLLTDVVQTSLDEDPVDKKITVAEKTFTAKCFPAIRHQVHRYLDLIGHLGGNPDYVAPRIWIEPSSISPLAKFVQQGSRPYLGIHAGAEYGPAKRWLPERFAEVAGRISEELPSRWLIFGGPNDVEIADAVEKQMRKHFGDPNDVVNVAGKTTLSELCGLVKFCRLLLTNDTGPMHLAAALGTRLVAVFGSTSPELTGPLGGRCAVIHEPVECSPCFLRECPIDFRCMNRITVDRVVQAVLQQLGNT
jgi:heptosyltransferase-2